MMIQIANSVVVMMIDFMPKPNRTISTGTRAVSGALRKMLTQGSSSSSSRRFLPIRMPIGTPITTAADTPSDKGVGGLATAPSGKAGCR